jgi:hypothetical protein
MKASTFTDAQKAFVIKQGDEDTPVADICRKAGINCQSSLKTDPLIGAQN